MGGPISIHLIAFDRSPLNPEAGGRILLRDSLCLYLPRPKRGCSVPYILAMTGSFARPGPARQVYNTSPRSRLHIFLIQVQHHIDNVDLVDVAQLAVMVAVKTSALMRLLYRSSDAPKELPWGSWAPGNVRIVEHGQDDGLSDRYVANHIGAPDDTDVIQELYLDLALCSVLNIGKGTRLRHRGCTSCLTSTSLQTFPVAMTPNRFFLSIPAWPNICVS